MRRIFFVLIALCLVLAITNPNEAEFRSHIQQKHGFAGALGLKLAAILSAGTSTGISRDNYLLCSRYYIGGDGILPRRNLAWGAAGFFFDIDEDSDDRK